MNIQKFRWEKFKDRWKTTHCVHGHEYTQDNIYIDRTGSRECKACKRRTSSRLRNTGCVARLTD